MNRAVAESVQPRSFLDPGLFNQELSVKQAVRAWLNRRLGAAQVVSDSVGPMVEQLEGRMMLSRGGPQVATIVADNRGQVKLTFTGDLNPATVNVNTVRILTAGADGQLDTADDVAVPLTAPQLQYGQKTLYITASTAANQLYRIQLVSAAIKGTNGRNLVGNGGAGGNFDEETVSPNFIAHFNTPAGEIQVTLDGNTPVTNQNFVNYANAGLWDGTFIHRNASSVNPTTLAVTKSHFIVQAGGFKVTSGKFDVVTNLGAIQNEPFNHNVKYTIAMAKLGGDPNSASNQFFFNLQDNSGNLDAQNGGFTAFGNVTNAPSQTVLNALDNNFAVAPVSSASFNGTSAGLFTSDNTTNALLPSANLQGGQAAGTGLFDNLPVQNVSTIVSTKSLDVLRDAVILYRVSFLMSILPTAQAGVISPAVARATSVAAASNVSPFSTTAVAPAAATGGSIFSASMKKAVWA
jgi:cyclophilin family peptidyl-prolyl cis-trans isomerase